MNMNGLANFSMSKHNNLSNKYMRIIPMTLLATMGLTTTHSGIKPATIEKLTQNEYVFNRMNDSVNLSKVIKTDTYTLQKDGTVVAYNYIHPDLLHNIKR